MRDVDALEAVKEARRAVGRHAGETSLTARSILSSVMILRRSDKYSQQEVMPASARSPRTSGARWGTTADTRTSSPSPSGRVGATEAGSGERPRGRRACTRRPCRGRSDGWACKERRGFRRCLWRSGHLSKDLPSTSTFLLAASPASGRPVGVRSTRQALPKERAVTSSWRPRGP